MLIILICKLSPAAINLIASSYLPYPSHMIFVTSESNTKFLRFLIPELTTTEDHLNIF